MAFFHYGSDLRIQLGRPATTSPRRTNKPSCSVASHARRWPNHWS